MASGSQLDAFSLSVGNAFGQLSPEFDELSSGWSQWDWEEEARLDAELDAEEDPTPEQIEKNNEVTEQCEMAREDHRQNAIDKMDMFAFWSTCPDTIRQAGYRLSDIPPLPWDRTRDGPEDPNDPMVVDFEERVMVLQRLYEDTIWKEGDPVPEVDTRAHRVYKKRRAERLVRICEECEAKRKRQRAEEVPVREPSPDQSKGSDETAPPRLLSDEFLLSLQWPDGIESWLGSSWSSKHQGKN